MSFQRTTLMENYSSRRLRNENYSLRAYARDLGLNPASLSQVLSGKRRLSPKNASKVARVLELDLARAKEFTGQPVFKGGARLEEAKFALVSDWFYLAVLNLCKLRVHKADPTWISKRLGITKVQASLALKRLQDLDLIKVTRGKMVRTTKPLDVGGEGASLAIQSYHRQTLELAARSLSRVSVKERDMSSLLVGLTEEDFEALRGEILKFKKRASKLSSSQAEEIYLVGVQAFPLTQGGA